MAPVHLCCGVRLPAQDAGVLQLVAMHQEPPALDPRLQRHCGIEDPGAWAEQIEALLLRAAGAVGPCPAPLLRRFALPLLQRLALLRGQGRLPVIGLNGPVGAGKSSLAAALQQLAPAFGLRLAVASIDDFYLPWPERCRAMAGNPFGVSRVPPGSHDPALLQRVLAAWRAGDLLRLPRFDKTLQGGEGDRSGERLLPADALVLEGWLLGCRPLGPGALQAALRPGAGYGSDLGPDLGQEQPWPGALALSAEERAWLPRWDRELIAYQPAWQLIDELWLLRPAHWGLPRRWRFQAEARQRRRLSTDTTTNTRRGGGGSGGAGGSDGASAAGAGWLAPAALDRLVRSSLCSLPPALYQEPLRLAAGVDRQASQDRSSDGKASDEGAWHGTTSHNTTGHNKAGCNKAGCNKAGCNKTIQPCPTAVEAELDGRRRLLAVRCRDSAFG